MKAKVYTEAMASQLLRTPFHANHVRAGARLVPFAGYEMPVQYKSIIAESKAVRAGVGMFDVSHMARLQIEGEGVYDYLEWVTANDVAKLGDGCGQYSLLPNEKGGCVDDIILYRIDATHYQMVVNAANHEKDVAWLRSHLPAGVTLADTTSDTAMLAVQGPGAVGVLAGISDRPDELMQAGAFQVVTTSVAGVRCFAARSGYTGEDGYELVCGAADASKVWDALLEAGVEPCGLGSRDVLRVEAGLPLYGHELSDDLSPIAAGLGWVIGKEKKFIGSGPINRARAEGTPRKLQGVRLDSKRLPAPGMKVTVEGKEVGEVTSGVFSPLLDCGIGFAFVDAEVSQGTRCEVEIRCAQEPGEVVNKRFFKRKPV